MGHRARLGGRDFAGVFDIDRPGVPPGTVPHIGIMVKVADVVATGARVGELGGTMREIRELGPAGRMAVCVDPTGARFDVWQVQGSPGPKVDATLVGALCWYELETADVARASAFYGALFGWEAQAPGAPPGDYVRFRRGEAYVAGAIASGKTPGQENDPPRAPAWATYFRAADVDAAARTTIEEGGAVFIPAHDVDGGRGGRSCGLVSPQGVAFKLVAGAPAG